MTQTNSRIWKNLWWAYFVLLALVLIRSLFSIQSPLDAAIAAFDGLGLVGLWAYLRSVAIGWRMLWVLYLVLFAVAIFCGVAGIALFAAKSGTIMSYVTLTALSFVTIPQWFALWRYVYRSPAIWQTARVAA
jgi:hypothetical protein